MKKVITYGTYDLLHYGHIRLLERAKKLGDYLIVGVTSDDYDKSRGKINVQQSLMERVEAVRATGLADEIIIEEYEGQKIDDIRRLGIDIFAIGSDWIGKFDYLREYCEVVYLERTKGVSSTEIRSLKREIRLGLIGDSAFLNKVYRESKFVNGITVTALLSDNISLIDDDLKNKIVKSYSELLRVTDCVYIRSLPDKHYEHILIALESGKHVLCESPITLSLEQANKLYNLANQKGVVLVEAIKTAYSSAFSRLLLLLKGGKIGKVVSIDATCTSLRKEITDWPGFYEWAPTAMLPVFELLGVYYKSNIITYKDTDGKDLFSRVNFVFEHAMASISVGNGVKSEGELIVSGTEGYLYVPAPWWKTDYFEIRYEDSSNNKRYFYQLDGEGIRYELVAFAKAIEKKKNVSLINEKISLEIVRVCEEFSKHRNVILI